MKKEKNVEKKTSTRGVGFLPPSRRKKKEKKKATSSI